MLTDATALLPVLAALLGAALAWLVGANAVAIGTALQLMDHPDGQGGRKRHAVVTPLVGGIAVAAAAVASALLASAGIGALPAVHLGWLALAVAVMFLIGAADDRFHLSPVAAAGGGGGGIAAGAGPGP